MGLSKSTFIRGLQCEKSLYLYKQIYAIMYNNEDSFIEDYGQFDGNLTESRGKDTNISFSIMTESGFTNLDLEDINVEILEEIETSGKDINEIKRSIFNKYLNASDLQ